jgi:hypothetical protein
VNQQDAVVIVPAFLARRGTSPKTSRFQLSAVEPPTPERSSPMLDSILPRRAMR